MTTSPSVAPSSLYAPGTVGAILLAVLAWRVYVLFTAGMPVGFDEGQYWGWAQEPAFGYYSKPPLLAWAMAAIGAVCGEAPGCVKLVSPLFHFGTGMVVYFLARHLFDARIGFWAALIYSSMPAVALSSLVATTDPPLLFFWALAMLCLVAALETNRRGWWVGLGLAIGFGLLAKYAMIFFVLCLALYAAWSPTRRGLWRNGNLWLAGGIALLCYLPNFGWNAANGFASYLHTGDNANLKGELFRFDKLFEFLGSQFGVFGPLLFGALLLVFARARHWARLNDRWRLLICFCLPVLAVITVQAFLSRANANWAATAYVSASVLVTAWLLTRTRWLQNLVAVSVALHVLVAAVGYNYQGLYRLFDVPLTAKNDPLKRLRGWEDVGAWALTLLDQHPGTRLLFDDRKTMATLIYYARPHGFDAVRWNPDGRITDHYMLTTSMAGREGESFILITRRADAGLLEGAFGDVTELGRLRQAFYPGYSLEVGAYLAEDFKGYPQ